MLIQAFLNPWTKYFYKEKDACFSELSTTALLTWRSRPLSSQLRAWQIVKVSIENNVQPCTVQRVNANRSHLLRKSKQKGKKIISRQWAEYIVAAMAPCMCLISGCVGRGVKLGSERLSGTPSASLEKASVRPRELEGCKSSKTFNINMFQKQKTSLSKWWQGRN